MSANNCQMQIRNITSQNVVYINLCEPSQILPSYRQTTISCNHHDNLGSKITVVNEGAGQLLLSNWKRSTTCQIFKVSFGFAFLRGGMRSIEDEILVIVSSLDVMTVFILGIQNSKKLTDFHKIKFFPWKKIS